MKELVEKVTENEVRGSKINPRFNKNLKGPKIGPKIT